MDVCKLHVIILGILFLVRTSSCFEPFSTTLALGTATVAAVGMLLELTGYTRLSCSMGAAECCTHHSIELNASGLKRDLNSQLHGQHLVIPTVLNALIAHVTDKNPSKPLVLSFHGWTGGGKNFVSRIITNNLYKKRESSQFVHVFNSELHFKHASKVAEYKDQLHSWIYHNVSKCDRSLFIFDEMDHMPEGMIDVLIPFLGHSTHVDKVDFRKAIFIFLSNIGGDLIMKDVLKQWHAGQKRESIKLRDMQGILELSAYNQKSGLKRSNLVHKQLIDHFVPFLPLERCHVRKCIVDEFRRQNITEYTESDIQDVLEELQWFPKGVNLFSKSGCKKIAQKIAVLGFTNSDL